MISPRSANITMLRAISEMAVAMMVSSVAEKPGGELAALLAGGDHVGVGADGDANLTGHRSGPPSVEQRLAEPGAPAAGEQVTTRIQVPLAALVPGRQREQHRAATGGRQLSLLQLKEVFHPEAGPRPAELRSDRTGGGIPTAGQRGRVHALDLVGDQRLLILLGQPAQGGGDRPALLTAKRLLLGKHRLPQVDEPMGVAPATLLVGCQGPGSGFWRSPRRRGRVRGSALARRHDPRERLLHQVLHNLPLTDAGGNDAPQQRCQLQKVVVPQLAGGPTSAQANHSCGGNSPSQRTVASQDHPARARAPRFPGACVMEDPATSQHR